MAFNFGTLSNVSVESNGNSFLRPWTINKNVKFLGISDVIEGNGWRAWDFEFGNEEGIYRERVFEPGDDADDRPEYTEGKPSPSKWDKIQHFIMIVLDTYNHEKVDAFKRAAGSFKSFEDIINVLKKLLTDSKVTADLKLTGRTYEGKIYAKLPTYVRLNSKTGDAFVPRDGKFLGQDLKFSSYELGEKAKFDNAKPTDMSAVSAPKAATTTSDVETNFDDLAALL